MSGDTASENEWHQSGTFVTFLVMWRKVPAWVQNSIDLAYFEGWPTIFPLNCTECILISGYVQVKKRPVYSLSLDFVYT